MRKITALFLLAVMLPILGLACLALRSLRDQQLVHERQRTLLYQGVAESVVHDVQAQLDERQREFAGLVDKLLGKGEPAALAAGFDDAIREVWLPVEVGFAVTLQGIMCNPSLFARTEARRFRLENDGFLCNREPLEVLWNSPKGKAINLTALDQAAATKVREAIDKSVFATKSGKAGPEADTAAGEAQFRHLVGDARQGTLARFLQDRLNLILWYRSELDPNYVFGALVNVPRLLDSLRTSLAVDPTLAGEIVAVLRDDNGQPVARSDPSFVTDWRRPQVSAELGEMLPHWEASVYLRNPAGFSESVRVTQFTVGLLIVVLVLVTAAGSGLIVADLRRQLTLARQKTDFVSNVSHELKTPLTSIRMFAEMLAEGRVRDPEKERHFLQIITAETSRLTRLINNVLDFARMERRESRYQMNRCDLREIAQETCDAYRPHLEAAGFQFECELAATPLPVLGDRDALAQVLVNLLSNAEKYCDGKKEITVQLVAAGGEGSRPEAAELSIRDRGAGIPRGCEERIFEQFFRAHDSLNSGIQGSGLGLTLSRQIARAHDGDVVFRRREGGGSIFTLRLPLRHS